MQLYDDKYYFIKPLGQGGFGKVFLAKEKVSNRYVAIKQLLSSNKSNQVDIIHEIEIVSKFNLPNIVNYYHHFYQDEKLFLVMEYCKGGSLREKIESKEINSALAFSYIQILASCLRIVHRNGVIHHDIKPDNILFTEGGTIKISDFGIANTEGGTKSYMSPEVLDYSINTKTDPRVDIYALGVTLMEILTGTNPFSGLSLEKIKEMHQQLKFPISHLKVWQQEIILKAINIIPELRFQYMVQFEEAIKAKSVPILFKKEVLRAAELVDHIDKALNTKKWRSALKYLELAVNKYPNNVSVLKTYGKYHLQLQQISEAKTYFEKALSLNPRLNLQKDLGWINLEFKNYPVAISLLSDHLHRHPSDYEAYNLLLRAYYETDRYETAMELAKMLMKSDQKLPCFANNYYISYVMHHLGKVIFPDSILKKPNHPFIDYNFSVVLDDQVTHNLDKVPTMKSKLLFMDFNFNSINKNTITFLENKDSTVKLESLDKCIIKIGRKGYDVNDIEVPGGNIVSRRHAIIVNTKDNVWLYDLESTGINLNNEIVKQKSPLIGLNTIEIGKTQYRFTTDNSKLF